MKPAQARELTKLRQRLDKFVTRLEAGDSPEFPLMELNEAKKSLVKLIIWQRAKLEAAS